MPTKGDIEHVLRQIPDPEIGVSLWDLGLIYGIEIDAKKGSVEIKMTLTSIGCPLFSLIAEPVKKEVGKLPGVKEVEVELTFDPPWTVEKMSKAAKQQMGFL
ncbi:MAG: metal-sulfur cluster assembly factor [Patescibacteria group bacterium]